MCFVCASKVRRCNSPSPREFVIGRIENCMISSVCSFSFLVLPCQCPSTNLSHAVNTGGLAKRSHEVSGIGNGRGHRSAIVRGNLIELAGAAGDLTATAGSVGSSSHGTTDDIVLRVCGID